jgi:hypothetical protein
VEGIRAVFAPAVSHQAVVTAPASVLLNKLPEFGFIFVSYRALLLRTFCRAAKVTNTIIIKPYPDKTLA